MGTYLSKHAVASKRRKSHNQALECLVFLLGEDAYGIDFLAVREIRGYEAVLPVAGAPDYLKGVINLRGTLVPVVDLRIRFGRREARYDHVTDILVIETGCGIGGLVVDNVSEVARIEPGEIGPVPGARAGAGRAYLSGATVRDGREVGFIDVGRIFRDIRFNPQACQIA